MLVVFYGLFHGLVFFPVLLSLIGPRSFDATRVVTEIPINAEELEPQLQCKDPLREQCELVISGSKTENPAMDC